MITRQAVALFAIATVALASCAANVSQQMPQDAIAKLEAAKDHDQRIRNDPSSDPAEKSDAFWQWQKADRTITKLQSGFPLPKSEIDDACEVPPIPISEDQRRQLVNLFKQHTNDCNLGLAATATDPCVNRLDLTRRALEQKENVPWSQIVDACEVFDPSHVQCPTPIGHLVVIFQENVSFDHYFATYPNAANNPGESVFVADPATPTVNGLTGALLSHNPNGVTPLRLSPVYAATCDQDHNYSDEQTAFHFGLMDNFPALAGKQYCTDKDIRLPNEIMNYYDGNTVTALWNYAQHFAMNDNSYGTTFGPSTPGAINLISGNTSGADPPNLCIDNTVYTIQGSVIDDADPEGDFCSSKVKGDICSSGDSRTPALNRTPTLKMSGRNVGDLLNEKGVSWGWFQGGFDRTIINRGTNTSGCQRATTSAITGVIKLDYIPHHEPFQYFERTSNPDHTRPVNVRAIGLTDGTNHQYDIHDFFDTTKAGNMPQVAFLKAPGFQDGHAQYSDPIDEQKFIVDTINFLMKRSEWRNTAVMIAYDDSDGWYDHQMGPIVKRSQTDQDGLTGPHECGDAKRGDQAPARCGYGPRLPLLVISPYAKKNFVDHTLTDQTSILKFIEDNWRLGQIGNDSYDAVAGSLLNMFDFSRTDYRTLILDSQTGEEKLN